jgi:hypothetical protein
LAVSLHRSELATIRLRRPRQWLELLRATLRFVDSLAGEQRHAPHSNAAQM